MCVWGGGGGGVLSVTVAVKSEVYSKSGVYYGRKLFEEDPLSGRPLSAKAEETSKHVNELIREDFG